MRPQVSSPGRANTIVSDSAANRYTTVIHIHVRDFMLFSSLTSCMANSGLPGAESQMRTGSKFKRRSGGG